jgi:hypothetical protein
MFLTHPIKAYGFEYPLVHLEADQSDLSKVSVPFLEGTYALYLAWVQAQIPAIVVEEPVVEEVKTEEPVVEEVKVSEEPAIEEVKTEEPAIEEVNEEPAIEEAAPRKRKA